MDLIPSLCLAAFDLFAPAHMIILLIVCLLLFGRRLPEIMRGLGSSVKEFRKGMNEDPPPPPTQNNLTPPPTPNSQAQVPPTSPDGTVPRDNNQSGQPPKA